MCGIKRLGTWLLAGRSRCCFVVASSGTNGVTNESFRWRVLRRRGCEEQGEQNQSCLESRDLGLVCLAVHGWSVNR